MSTTIDCRQARPEDFEAISNLLELYQYELSNIWDQELDALGRYGYVLDRHREGQRFFAHLAQCDQPVDGWPIHRSEGH